jgi:murein L,D-transpeptidase YafK
MVVAVRQGVQRMRMIIMGSRLSARGRAMLAAVAGACALAACSGAGPTIPPSDQPLDKDTLMLLGRKGMDQRAPILVRIFKEESELEVWKARDDGRFYHFKTYPICNWSGELGPKTTQGDHQAPEGFYKVSADQLNPNSRYYLAFNIGYPNAYDRSLRRTGDALMVHGKCISAGCYAMTDALIEEIYGLAREALKGGQESFQVHAFPFRMTHANMARYRDNPNYKFWKTLKQGYDFFETYRLPPQIAVCEHRYLVNVKLAGSGSFNPSSACPRYTRPVFEPFVPRPGEQQVAQERINVPGPKMREVASATPPRPTPAARPEGQPDFATSFGLGGVIETGSTASGPPK